MTFAPDTHHLGASWYPENWPEEEWEADADRMAELGFTLMRLFEFAWHRFEPAEGVYDFAWAERVLDLLHERGIKAMIGTPTAAPPAWLTTAYPEVLRTRADGSRARHGKRRHGSAVSARYREHAARIAGAMAEAFAGHPALHSWQIDNEMSGHDYGEEATRRFRDFLRERFGDIASLNRAWGLEFWSQAYDDFEQIELCPADVGSREAPERNHPSLIMATCEFQNRCWDGFIAAQCEAIRACSDKPITTNMTGLVGSMDWFRHNRNLDFVGASMYADLAHYQNNYPRFDRMRAEKPGSRYMLLETAPNWSGGGPVWNIHHCPDGLRLLSWLSTLAGSAGTIFWQWRSHHAGQEMQHGTHVSATGKWRPGKEAWHRLAREYAELGPWLSRHPPRPAETALMMSTRAAWAFSIDPIDRENRYAERFRDDYHLPLARHHIHRDVIGEGADFSPYRVLLLPHIPILRADTRRRLAAWVEAGGVLLLGPLTGYRTEEFTAFTDHEFGGLEDLMGATCSGSFSPQWVESEIDVAFADGHRCHPRIWCDRFIADDATVLAHYHGGWGDGGAAVLEHEYGEGRVITLGCPVDEATWLQLVHRALEAAGLGPVAVGSTEVYVVPRCDATGHTVAYGVANTSREERAITLPAGGHDLLADEHVHPDVDLAPLQVRLIKLTGG